LAFIPKKFGVFLSCGVGILSIWGTIKGARLPCACLRRGLRKNRTIVRFFGSQGDDPACHGRRMA
jgi:hypothetical protein